MHPMPSTHRNTSTTFQRSPAPRRPEPQLFRFGLRQLFFAVAAAAGFLTLLAATDGPWPWIIAFLAALVAAHVAGNSLGTRLRDTSVDVRQWRATYGAGAPDDPAATPQPIKWAELSLPEPTPLRLHQPAPRRRVQGATILGALGCGAGGAVALAYVAGEQATWPGFIVGAISCGVMGAWLAMLVSSFWMIARQAWKHANGKR